MVTQEHVRSRDAKEELGEPQAGAFHMVVAAGARGLVAPKALKGGLPTAKPMEAAAGVSTLVAPRVQKAALIIVSATVAGGGAPMMAARKLQGVTLVSASAMGVARGARRMAAPGVRKGFQASASPMVEGGDASTQGVARREHRGGQPSASRMGVEDGALTLTVGRVPRGVPHSARVMEEEKGVCSREEGSAVRACTGEQTSVSLTGVERGVRCPNATKVQGEGLLFASGMEEGRGAGLLDVRRALREAPTSARPMGAEGGAHGTERETLALPLLGEELTSVLSMMAWCRKSSVMGLMLWGVSWWSIGLGGPVNLLLQLQTA